MVDARAASMVEQKAVEWVGSSAVGLAVRWADKMASPMADWKVFV